MQEYTIEGQRLEELIGQLSAKLGMPAGELRAKLSGLIKDGKITVNEQIYHLLHDQKKLDALLSSGILNRLLKDFLGRKNGQ